MRRHFKIDPNPGGHAEGRARTTGVTAARVDPDAIGAM